MASAKGSDGKGGRTSKRSTTIDLAATEVTGQKAAETGEDDLAPSSPEDTATTVAAGDPAAETPTDAVPAEGTGSADAAISEASTPGAPGTPEADVAQTPAADAEPVTVAEAMEQAAMTDNPPPPRDERAAAAPAPASSPAPSQTSSLAPSLIAACVGGAIVLAGVYGLGAAGVLPGSGAGKADVAAVQALEARIDALGAPDAETTARLDGLAADLADARSAIEASGTAASEQARSALDDLTAAIAEERTAREGLASELQTARGDLAAQIEAAASAATTELDAAKSALAELREATGGNADALGALSQRVDGLPTTDYGPELKTLTSRADAFGTRLGLVDDTVSDISASTAGLKQAQEAIAATQAATGERIAAIEGRVGELDTLRGDLDAARGALSDLDAASKQGDDALGGRLGDVESRIAALDETLKTLDGRLASVEQILARAPEEGEIAALSLAVTTLAGKVDRGVPFAADLAAVKASAADLPGIEALEPFAETGIPTRFAVIGSFPRAEVMASDKVQPDAAPLDRLFAGARNLVNYRETGAADGAGVGPLSAEIESHLAAGDLVAAKATWDKLPEPARAASADWEKGLVARIAAEEAIAALTDRMVERLSVTVNKS